MHRVLQVVVVTAAALAASSCGGGSGSSSVSNGPVPPSSTNNNAPVVVDAGPQALQNAGMIATNLPFVSVTVCVPNTSTCQTIDHVQVDTGSSGLRIVSSVLTLPLPQQMDSSGANPVAECNQFGDGFTWGPVQTADIQIAGEQAKAVPIQVTNGSFHTIPQACLNTGPEEDDVVHLGANGILGVGVFRQDCGSGCALVTSDPNFEAFYYSCPAAGCQPTSESATAQLQNPVWMFATDNNGVVLQLPAIASSSGQATASGSLFFGIGTQADNSISNANVVSVDSATGLFAVTFAGTLFNDFKGPGSGHGSSILDSGSNAIFFLDTSTPQISSAGLRDCPSPEQGFYCGPNTPQPFTAEIQGDDSFGTPSGSMFFVNFGIEGADKLPGNFSAFNDIGGANPNAFDFGLPFFFGRSVYTAIEGQNTPDGAGPFFAFK